MSTASSNKSNIPKIRFKAAIMIMTQDIFLVIAVLTVEDRSVLCFRQWRTDIMVTGRTVMINIIIVVKNIVISNVFTFDR